VRLRTVSYYISQAPVLIRPAISFYFYEHRFQRRVEKNMQMLRELQQERKAAFKQAAEEVVLLTQLAESKGETFDIERDFPIESLPPQFVFSKPEIARLAAHLRRLAEAKKQSSAPAKTLSKAA